MRPFGLGARLAFLIGAALLAANLVALVLLAAERERAEGERLAGREMERVASAVLAMDGAGPEERRRIARAGGRRMVRMTVSAAPAVAGIDPAAARAAEHLVEETGPRDVRAEIRPGPGRGRLRLSVALEEPPGWLNAEMRVPPARTSAGRAYLLILGLSLAAVLGVTLLAARRLTRPLRALSEAARAAGRGDRSASVPERGARELQEAARAFNDMQSRIEAFEAERARTLAALGHDLRTPITALRIRAEMLDDETREAMGRSLSEMEIMADGLLASGRGASAEEPGPVDLAAQVRRIAKEMGAELGEVESVRLSGRPVALSRAVSNLVGNALRYAGSARLSLRRDRGAAVIAVEDEGPGIPEDRLEAVMEPFVRGEGSRSAETGGAGLGLSIARDAARRHGGTLRLANRTGGGLRAELRLPLR